MKLQFRTPKTVAEPRPVEAAAAPSGAAAFRTSASPAPRRARPPSLGPGWPGGPTDRDADLTDALDGIWYTIDRDLTIRSLSRKNWARSAAENELPRSLSAENVLGRNLMQFIAGVETRATFSRFCADILEGRRESITCSFGCDAPGVRRDMRLSIKPLLRNSTIIGAVFHNVRVSVALRPPVDFLRNPTCGDGERDVLSICSFCQRVRRESDPRLGDWMRAEDYYRRGGDSDLPLSHAICEDCQQSLTRPAA